MKSPRFSVIVPARNRAAYLREALESVFAQTLQDYEIIVVDDGSTDETPAVAKSFGKRVRLLRQECQGAGAARNHGVEEARGKYVAFLDSDDVWLPQKLAVQSECLERESGISAVACNTESFGAKESRLRCPPDLSTRRVFDVETVFRSHPIQTSTVVVQKERFKKTGGFNPLLVVGEDFDLWMRLAASSPIYHSPRVLAKYRVHMDSLSEAWKQQLVPTEWELRDRFLHEHPDLRHVWAPWVHEWMFRMYYESLVYPSLIKGQRRAVRIYLRRARAHRPWRLKTYFHELLTWLPKGAFKAWRRRWSESVAYRLQLRTYECLRKGRLSRARIYAMLAVRYRPLRIKNYIYLLFSRLSPSAYTLARSLKQKAWSLPPRR